METIAAPSAGALSHPIAGSYRQQPFTPWSQGTRLCGYSKEMTQPKTLRLGLGSISFEFHTTLKRSVAFLPEPLLTSEDPPKQMTWWMTEDAWDLTFLDVFHGMLDYVIILKNISC